MDQVGRPFLHPANPFRRLPVPTGPRFLRLVNPFRRLLDSVVVDRQPAHLDPGRAPVAPVPDLRGRASAVAAAAVAPGLATDLRAAVSAAPVAAGVRAAVPRERAVSPEPPVLPDPVVAPVRAVAVRRSADEAAGLPSGAASAVAGATSRNWKRRS